MIGRAMQQWPDDALRRVVDAPVERWATEWVWRGDKGCLLGHACGRNVTHEGAAVILGMGPGGGAALEVGEEFDDLADRFGLPRTVRAIKRRALRILLERHPLDSRLVVLQASGAEHG